ncbi:MAG: LacI family DNA-binding transcriptional regulator [Burkholderiaceae bacterium]|nr:LacI family DNA-binding transcriptional regulator [Microbacteriaceae bacterium]
MVPPGIRDVAARAEVSVGTVSNVLNRPTKVSPAATERVLAAIEELGFVRNDAARQLRAGHSSAIGLIVLDARNPFFTDVARGAEDQASVSGFSVLMGNTDDNPDREAGYLDLFEQQRVAGVLISPIGDVTARLQRLRDRGIAAVLVDRSGDATTFSSVSVDDVAGGRLAVDHLIDSGRRRIAFVGGPFAIRQVDERYSGAEQSVAGHPDTTLETVRLSGLTVLEGRRAGAQILARPAADRPDAIFAANDLIAMGLLQAFMMAGATGISSATGISVPDDIAIIGYDDIDFASAAVVPLSSIRQPSSTIGQTAVTILLEEADDADLPHRQVVFQPELVVRQSTRSE